MEAKRMKHNIQTRPITLTIKRFKPVNADFIGLCDKVYRT